jgi:drug/metabolite transporter (DMT)-like permease
MPYLAEFLLFLVPFAAYALWRRLNPGREPSSRVVWLALAGIGLGLAGAVSYGLSRSIGRDSVYVPPVYRDGQLIPGHAEPRR